MDWLNKAITLRGDVPAFHYMLGCCLQAQRKVDRVVQPIRARAERAAKRIEVEVADQVGAAFGRLGVPSKNEVAALLARVEQLQKQVKAKARARAR